MDSKQKQKQIERPPVVCIMGHIDHGKSTLLDYIRKTNIVDTEAGGITQKISAYEVVHKNKRITFLDTPGHESFSKIRERGADVADIAILVVSAEDGVKKQTIEAANCIKESGIPFIVAINKIDKPGADIEKTKISLAENEIYLEGYGGSIPFMPISAKTGQGVNELLDLLLLAAEMEELRGNLDKEAQGIVIETNLDKQKGISASLVIKDGTLKSGMYIACGKSYSPTRIMEDFRGKKINEATFSSPIKIIGFDSLPKVGYSFFAFLNKEEAIAYAQNFQEQNKKVNSHTEISEEGIEIVNLIIKADNIGSLEGIEHELAKIDNEKVKIQIIHSGVGDITENDLHLLGNAVNSLVVGFNVRTDTRAKLAAEKLNIEIKVFDIIYKLSEWLAEVIKNKTPKVSVEEKTGRAKVLKFFSAVKDKNIIGARVEEGEIKVGDEVKILRNEVEVGRGKIKELQQAKEKVSAVRSGVEFGCQIQSVISPAPGDKLEAYSVVIH